MSYSRDPWTYLTPLGTDPANGLATNIENLRQDIEERMTTLVTGWQTGSSTDPIVPRPFISGAVTGKTLYLAGSDWVTSNGTVYANNNPTYAQLPGSGTLQISFRLPIGATLQAVKVLGMQPSGTASTFKVYRSQFVAGGAPGFAQIGSTTSYTADGVWRIYSITGLAHTVQTGYSYYAQIVSTAGVTTNAATVEVTYDSIDSTTTL